MQYTDPLGLDWLDDTSDWVAGFGDTATFGLTKQVRRGINWGLNGETDDMVNNCSDFYMWGGVGGGIATTGLDGVGLATAAQRVTSAGRLVSDAAKAEASVAQASLRQTAAGGRATASQLDEVASSLGWTRSQSATGPVKFTDKTGVDRLTIKQGSARTPGSEGPHVEIRNSDGMRIDPFGNLVTRKSPGNHTPIVWDW